MRADEPRLPRTLLFSQRGIGTPVWRAAQFEFEDVIAAVDDVELLAPAGRARPAPVDLGARFVNRARRAAGRPRRGPMFTEPAMQREELTRDYDLLFCVIDFPWHLDYLRALPDWRARCRTAVCYLSDMWTPWVERYADYLSVLQEFDHVFALNGRVIEPLAALSRRSCDVLPPAVDAFRFCPYPEPPARAISWYSFGRRSPQVHSLLLGRAERDRRLYLHDTVAGGTVLGIGEHRRLLADLVGRSEHVICHRVIDSPERAARSGGDDCLSTRYFEGTAGGAVVIGSAPQCPEYDWSFDWPDATVPAAYDGHDLLDVLDALERDPERVARIRQRNVTGALRRHDWVHRWLDVLAAAGLAPTAAAQARVRRLDELADQVDADLEAARAAGRVHATALGG